MKEHPILFSGEMVRAILDGRKTQTRRILKNADCFACLTGDCPHEKQRDCDAFMQSEAEKKYPVGSKLWENEIDAVYRATETDPDRYPGHWKPSIFMPRRASRITLEIVSVRVERLQDISQADAMAEGVTVGPVKLWKGATPSTAPMNAIESYKSIWESINGKGSWEKNNYVWVITFKKL